MGGYGRSRRGKWWLIVALLAGAFLLIFLVWKFEGNPLLFLALASGPIVVYIIPGWLAAREKAGVTRIDDFLEGLVKFAAIMGVGFVLNLLFWLSS